MLRYYRELLKDFKKVPGMVIVYGSVASEKSRLDSDIDLAIVSENKKTRVIAEEIADQILFRDGRVVSILWLTPDDIKERSDDPFIQDVLGGEILYGREIIEGMG